MSISTTEEEGAVSNTTSNGTPYVPDGVYAPDTPTSSTDSLEAPPSTQQVSTEPATSQAPTKALTSKNLCGVCHENQYKYKCSRCELPSCSQSCSTIHKDTHPVEETPATKPLPAIPVKPTTISAARAGTVAASTQSSPFAALSTSPELRALFSHYPNLSQHLDTIWTAMQPPIPQSPDLYFKLTGKSNNPRAWNQDRGVEKGVEALHKAREMWGKDGEGVREFGELVLRFVEGVDKEESVRRELEGENARIVRALMEGEL